MNSTMLKTDNFPIMDVVSHINQRLNRNIYNRNKVAIEAILTCLGDVFSRFNFTLNEKLLEIAQSCNNDFEICVFGLFGYCDPKNCSDCLKMHDELVDDVWNTWCLQSKPIFTGVKSKQMNTSTPSVSLRHVHTLPNQNIDDNLLELARETLNLHSNQIPGSNQRIKCKFGVTCNNHLCAYLHLNQINCKYGFECHDEKCLYRHPILIPHKETELPQVKIIKNPHYPNSGYPKSPVDDRTYIHDQRYSKRIVYEAEDDRRPTTYQQYYTSKNENDVAKNKEKNEILKNLRQQPQIHKNTHGKKKPHN